MKKIRLLILPIITIILQILPCGAVLVFAPSPTERVRETFSYFNLTPFGYANFAPFITALLTCIILLLALISIKLEKMRKAVFWLSLATAIISLLPLVFGIDYYSVVGGIITITLAIESVLAKISAK
jgi:glucan phosphoethanolaminetransferase (alkaline phosphatase superfamily)